MGALYQITFPNGKGYIGVTKHDARTRFVRHACAARRGQSFALSNALRKYGIGAATIKTLVVGEFEFLLYLEPRAIAAFGTKFPNGYNLTDGGEGIVGLSPEARSRMSEAAKRRVYTPEVCANMSAGQKGKIITPEHRLALSKALKGKTRTAETRAKISAYVRNRPPEVLKKISESLKARHASSKK